MSSMSETLAPSYELFYDFLYFCVFFFARACLSTCLSVGLPIILLAIPIKSNRAACAACAAYICTTKKEKKS
jgi:hypothetical protein